MGIVKRKAENDQDKVKTKQPETNKIISDSKILDIIMNNSQDTIYFKDKDSKFIANSKAHAMQVNCENLKDMVGKSDFDFFPEEFAMQAYLDEKKIMETGIPILGKQEKLQLLDGNYIWVLASKYPIYDEKGEIIGTWGISRDITALHLAQEDLARLNSSLACSNIELQKRSDLDGLSELFNQRKFYEVLARTIEIYQNRRDQNESGTFCVVLMDIDEFKLINDKFGHPVGDQVIHYIGEIIQKNKRQEDYCFRCGGDEFAMILMDTVLEDALYVAERLRKTIEKNSFRYEEHKIKITISVGVEECQEEDIICKVLEKVDKKLYLSKNKGKNQVN